MLLDRKPYSEACLIRLSEDVFLGRVRYKVEGPPEPQPIAQGTFKVTLRVEPASQEEAARFLAVLEEMCREALPPVSE